MSINNYDNSLNGVLKSENFDFSKNTTYGLGGFDKTAYFPKNSNELMSVFNHIKRQGDKLAVIGNGSDILASDKGFDGSVICTKSLKGITLTDNNTVICQAGATVSELLKLCTDNGLGGLEYLAGIPATLGGVVCMNAGAGGRYICGDVVKVDYFDGKNRSFSNKQCKFDYKYSIMRDIIGVISTVELKIEPKNREIVERDIKNVLSGRSWHPKGKSCGCVFMNPAGLSAGKIIDDCGLKGACVGGAVVSDIHANFILNRGGSSSDVKELIDRVKNTVLKNTGILLREEVVYIGDF